jgi:hypothetical protein
MRKIVLTFGLIAGAIMSAMMFVTLPFKEQIGFEKGMIIGYTTMVLAFLMVFFGVRSYRDNVAGGSVSFGRAFKVATWEFIFFRLAPDYGDAMAAASVEKVRKEGGTEAEIAAKTKEMQAFAESYRNPLVNIAYTFLEPLPVGLLFVLVTAGVASRKRRVGGSAVAT